MGPYIVGFDPLGYYIPTILRWIRYGVGFWHYIATAPLFYSILAQATSLGVPLTLSLKIIPSILHGFLGLAIYLYANIALAWSHRKSLFTTLLATLYFVALRISWDLLRVELGLALLFITLTLLQKNRIRWKHYTLLSLTMILVVLAHQFVTIIMLFIIAIMVMSMLLDKNYNKILNIIITSTPATLLFFLIIYANYATSNLVIFPKTFSPFFTTSSYLDIVIHILGLLFYCYLPILPLAIMGIKHFQNLHMKSWIFGSLVLILFPVVSNTYIIGGGHWTFMLTYPLAFYVVEALWNMKQNSRRLRVSIILGVILTMLTVGFMVMPSESPFPYYAIPQFQNYVPSSMLQNTVPLGDCQDVVNSLNWLKSNMNENSVLLTHTAFHGWALLTLNMDQVVPYGYGNPERATENVTQQGYRQIYLIWWTEGEGWHDQPSAPQSFKEVYASNRIAVYVYKPELGL
jgi:hypothetical protein